MAKQNRNAFLNKTHHSSSNGVTKTPESQKRTGVGKKKMAFSIKHIAIAPTTNDPRGPEQGITVLVEPAARQRSQCDKPGTSTLPVAGCSGFVFLLFSSFLAGGLQKIKGAFATIPRVGKKPSQLTADVSKGVSFSSQKRALLVGEVEIACGHI